MRTKRICAGLYEITTDLGVFGLHSVKPYEDVGYGLETRWYLVQPGCSYPDDVFCTKRDALLAISDMLAA
jgi:hypothetical protein